MATDQEIRDAGFKYVPQQKYLQNPFVLPEDQEPSGILATNAFTNSDGNNYNPYNFDPNLMVNKNYNPYTFRNAAENSFLPGGSNATNPKYLNQSFDPSKQIKNAQFMYNKAFADLKDPLKSGYTETFGTPNLRPSQQVMDYYGEKILDNQERYRSQGQYETVPSEFAYSGQTELEKLKEMYPGYFEPKPLEGIPGAVQQYIQGSIPGRMLKKGTDALNSILPTNRRAILENELGGQGIMVNSTGQIVSDGGDINTPQNIMAGYNAYKVDADTFQKRRDMINKTMSKPGYKGNLQEKLDALNEAEAMMLGTATDRTNVIFDDKEEKKKKKKEKSTILNFLKTKKTADTTGTDTTSTDTVTGNNNVVDSTVYANQNDPSSVSTSGLTYTQGGGQEGSYDFVEQDFGGNQNSSNVSNQESQENAAYDFARGGRVNYKVGGRTDVESQYGEDSVGSYDSSQNKSDRPQSYGNNDNNQVINNPVDISTVTKSVGDYEIPYGLEALIADKAKFQAVLDADDILNKNLGLDVTYDQGPYQIGFNADMEGNKNLGLTYNKGNLSAYASTDFNNPTYGVEYSKAFAYGGLASIL